MQMGTHGLLAEIMHILQPQLEEILARVDETTVLGEDLHDIGQAVIEMGDREPEKWELQSVRLIREYLSKHLSDAVRSQFKAHCHEMQDCKDVLHAVANTTAFQHAVEYFKRVLESEKAALLHCPAQDEQCHALAHANRHERGQERTAVELDDMSSSFWKNVARNLPPELSMNASESTFLANNHSNTDICVFDDFHSDFSDDRETDLSSLVEQLKACDEAVRTKAILQLTQIQAQELEYSGVDISVFTQSILTAALTNLDSEQARKAMKVLLHLTRHMQEANSFIQLYSGLFDTVGELIVNGTLCLKIEELVEGSHHTLLLLDIFRVLYSATMKLPMHWKYILPETVAKLFCSTFQLLNARSEAVSAQVDARPSLLFALLDPTAKWFYKWLLSCPHRRQLFIIIEESSFIAKTLNEQVQDTNYEHIQHARQCHKIALLASILEYTLGRSLLYRWKTVKNGYSPSEEKETWQKNDELELHSWKRENNQLFHLFPESNKQSKSSKTYTQGSGPNLVLEAVTWAAVAIFIFSPTATKTNCSQVWKPAAWVRIFSRAIQTFIECNGNKTAFFAHLLQTIQNIWMYDRKSLLEATAIDQKAYIHSDWLRLFLSPSSESTETIIHKFATATIEMGNAEARAVYINTLQLLTLVLSDPVIKSNLTMEAINSLQTCTNAILCAKVLVTLPVAELKPFMEALISAAVTDDAILSANPIISKLVDLYNFARELHSEDLANCIASFHLRLHTGSPTKDKSF